MRRTVIAVAVAAACLAAGMEYWRRTEKRLALPAELVPAETLLLADFPDLPRSAMRWKETDLCAIFNEPQVQTFLAKPLEALQNEEAASGMLHSLQRIEPKQAFLAVASITNNMPRAVGGIEFAGERAEMERLLERARAQARNASPNGKLETQRYRNFQIESFSANGITLAGCFARNWYFLANDVDLLKATLDRYSGKTHTTLANAPAYLQSQAALPPNPDFRLFTQPGAISERLIARLNASGQPLDAQEGAELRKIRAVAVASRMEGPRLRGAFFIYEPEIPAHPVLNSQTLGLTTPKTLLYAAMALLISDATPQRGPQVMPRLIPMRILMQAALNSPPATLGQFKTAFGPELALMLDLPPEGTEPNFFLVSEIRDLAEARRFMESVFHAWNRADAEGVSFWTLTMEDPSMAQFHPTVALTAHHALAGLSPESLKPFATNAVHLSGSGATLEQSPAFQGSMATLPKPKLGLVYLDVKPLFERVYGWLRPAAMLWGNGVAGFGGAIDYAKLPTPSVISGHLSPISLSAVQTDSGILMESTGPVSFLELGAGLGAAALVIALPALEQPSPIPGKGIPRRLPFSPPNPLSVPQNSPALANPVISTSSQPATAP